MIVKQKSGKNFRGVLRYIHGETKGAEILATRNIRDTSIDEMCHDFLIGASISRRVQKPVYHTSISLSKNDNLNNDQMRSVAEEWLKGMGLYESQWTIVKHNDANPKNPHVHLIVNRVLDNGKVWSTSQNYKRSATICRELENKYGLTPVPSIRNEKDISIDRLKGKDLFKSQAHRAIQDVLKKAKSIEEFNLLMKERNIECHWTFNSNDNTPRGLTFTRDGVNLKASNINRLYGAAKISAYIDYRNKKIIVNQTQETYRAIDRAIHNVTYHANQIAKANSNTHYPDEDILALDKILFPNQSQRLKI